MREILRTLVPETLAISTQDHYRADWYQSREPLGISPSFLTLCVAEAIDTELESIYIALLHLHGSNHALAKFYRSILAPRKARRLALS